jgi:hypothetical protein
MPRKLGNLPDCLRRLLRIRRAEEQVRAGILDLEDLRIDGLISVSLAPGSYFFCAWADDPITRSQASYR